MSKWIKYYLLAYNLSAFVFWALYLLYFLDNRLRLGTYNLPLLNIAQGMALLEIFHVLVGWIKSPLSSTIAQVLSRLLILVLINIYFDSGPLPSTARTGMIIVSLALGITELVRYSFYFTGLLGFTPRWLMAMRYTFFIVLYPLGVTGEFLILFTPMVSESGLPVTYIAFTIVVSLVYIYYFPVLYKYMWKQRRLKLTNPA